MLGVLALDGYSLVSDPDGADFVIINTCGFIESARQESKSVINEMLELKRQGRTKGVIVAGCLPERLGSTLLEEMPEIDHIVGVFGRDETEERRVGKECSTRWSPDHENKKKKKKRESVKRDVTSDSLQWHRATSSAVSL